MSKRKDAPVKGMLVLGMHRSGTSALSRVLGLCGFDLGERLLGVLFAGNQVLANLVVLPVAALLTTVLMVLMGGNMLFAYRDVFGADAPAGDAPVSELML